MRRWYRRDRRRPESARDWPRRLPLTERIAVEARARRRGWRTLLLRLQCWPSAEPTVLPVWRRWLTTASRSPGAAFIRPTAQTEVHACERAPVLTRVGGHAVGGCAVTACGWFNAAIGAAVTMALVARTAGRRAGVFILAEVLRSRTPAR
jgi:hypothetical protein